MNLNTILQGDCLEKLKDLKDNSIDSIVTDPPYELGFMGKSWDNTGIAYNIDMWKECLRVLKPGGHLLSFSGTRTYHRMAVAIEDAGFEVRDMIEWIYSTGFPKSLNIGKAVDKLQGNEREVIGDSWNMPDLRDVGKKSKESIGIDKLSFGQVQDAERKIGKIDKGTSKWEGWGTALKPAHEPICMARKPLAEKTVAENCLKWGTGGINIDESRVEHNEPEKLTNRTPRTDENVFSDDSCGFKTNHIASASQLGRFPANLIHDNSEEVRECFPETVGAGNNKPVKARDYNATSFKFGTHEHNPNYYNNTGGNASRFFKSIIYTAKASKSERNMGCDGLEEKEYEQGNIIRQVSWCKKCNHLISPKQKIKGNCQCEKPGKFYKQVKIGIIRNNHPTVKPVALMSYLIKMVTPKGGVVLDPFFGSGSTGVACLKSGFKYIGIEISPEYCKIAERRLAQQILL